MKFVLNLKINWFILKFSVSTIESITYGDWDIMLKSKVDRPI